jgi:cobalamin biosynthesis protein CobW
MKIPVTIVTGFLGSGKTTLISGLLKKNPDRRLAVLVNEFGEVSVDGALLRTAGEECGVEIHDLPNGCICCTIKDDFLPIMSQLQKRKQEIDHILIETSGLALPTPVMRALAWPEVRNDFQLDAVLAVVDTPQLLAGNLDKGNPIPGADVAEIPEHVNSVDLILNQQLENADVVVLNKIDELEEERLLKAEDIVREKAAKVRFLELAYHAELDTRLCMGLSLHDEPEMLGPDEDHDHHDHHHGPVQSAPLDADTPVIDQHQFDGHSHTGLASHEHSEQTHQHFHEHDPGWQSFVLRSSQPQDAEKLKAAVKEVSTDQPVLRAKGFASIDGKHHRLVLQAVRNRVQAYFEDAHSHDPESQLVFIGYHCRRDRTTKLMSELTGTVWE